MGGAALIAAAKYDIMCVGEKGEEGVWVWMCVCVCVCVCV